MDESRLVDWVPRKARREERETGVTAVVMVAVAREDDDGRDVKSLGRGAVDPHPVCAAERAQIEAADDVRAALARAELDWRERMVLYLRAEGRTLAQVGAELGVSESRACQLERRAVNAVRWWHGLGDESPSFGRGGG